MLQYNEEQKTVTPVAAQCWTRNAKTQTSLQSVCIVRRASCAIPSYFMYERQAVIYGKERYEIKSRTAQRL